jgi:hypothetical protein
MTDWAGTWLKHIGESAWPRIPSGLEEGEIALIVVRSYPSKGGQSPQGNGGRDGCATFEGWTRATTPQSDEWARKIGWHTKPLKLIQNDKNFE